MVKSYFLVFIFLLFQNLVFASKDSSSYYFVYFKDKNTVNYSLNRPYEYLSQRAIDRRKLKKAELDSSDLPVSSVYITAISRIQGVIIINKSKWLNGIEIKCESPEDIISKIASLKFVKQLRFLGRIKNWVKPEIETIEEKFLERAVNQAVKKDSLLPLPDIKSYGKSWKQNEMINTTSLHGNNYADRIYIAVIDAGFFNAYKVKGMEDLLLSTVIKKDFVDYDNSVWEDDKHGANVLGFLKTYDPGNYIGSAPQAEYALFRTENAANEYPVEEINWVFAAEYADSLGVDLISSSVGYHTFDDNSLSHSHTDLNGSSIIATAANMAYRKGIMVVTSAGNEGANKWHKIGTPSDATGVIGIGASDENGFHASFSSYGYSSDGRVKPDFIVLGQRAIVASPAGTYAGTGTSYSTPIFAGGLACLMQICPDKSNDEIKKALILSSTHYHTPDSAYGYGLPDLGLALYYLGKYNHEDTLDDLFYLRNNPLFFQDLNIHFRSSKLQIVKITVKGQRRKKLKNLYQKSFALSKGEWLNEGILMRIFKSELGKKRKKKIKTLVLILETESGSIQKTIRINYKSLI